MTYDTLRTNSFAYISGLRAVLSSVQLSVENIAKDEIPRIQADIVKQMFDELLRLTPVDTGFLKSNWLGSLGFLSSKYRLTKHRSREKLTTSSIPTIDSLLPRLRVGDTIYLQNPTVYFEQIDQQPYRAGSQSRGVAQPKAPSGMTGPAMKMLPDFINAALGRSQRRTHHVK